MDAHAEMNAVAGTEKKPVLWRVLLALLLPPVCMMLVFFGFGTYFAVTRGLRGAEIAKVMEGIATWAVLLNLLLILFATLALARKDGLSLRTLGWSFGEQSPVKEIVIGLFAGAVLGAVTVLAWRAVVAGPAAAELVVRRMGGLG